MLWKAPESGNEIHERYRARSKRYALRSSYLSIKNVSLRSGRSETLIKLFMEGYAFRMRRRTKTTSAPNPMNAQVAGSGIAIC